MIDLAPINLRLASLGLVTVEQFCLLYNQRFHDTPAMLAALEEWQETYHPVQLERIVGKRLIRFTELPWEHLVVDELISLLEDDGRRAAHLATLRKIKVARQLKDWVSGYFLEITM